MTVNHSSTHCTHVWIKKSLFSLVINPNSTGPSFPLIPVLNLIKSSQSNHLGIPVIPMFSSSPSSLGERSLLRLREPNAPVEE
jgi:hypothetical protein